jgi:hypothetical protein
VASSSFNFDPSPEWLDKEENRSSPEERFLLFGLLRSRRKPLFAGFSVGADLNWRGSFACVLQSFASAQQLNI